jgi:eukaryotic-like serine/threonine-protein kinase
MKEKAERSRWLEPTPVDTPGDTAPELPARPSWTPEEETSTGGVASGSGAAGRLVPHYRILGPLGIGGMGVVYRAQDTRLGRIVALKFLAPTLTANPQAKRRLLAEARVTSALDHPNICTVYEIGTAGGQLYLAMACYDGETLKERLKRGPIAAPEAVRIAMQVARGLAKAHQHGIIHRDVKPANLMITGDGMVKILDFGIAGQTGRAAPLANGPVPGTPGYMAPEQARGGEVDARSDIWSLGAVLQEMLTGFRPGGESSADAGPAAPAGRFPGQLAAVIAPLNRVLSRMLATEPAARYADAGALAADLAALDIPDAVPGGKPAARHARLSLRLAALILVPAALLLGVTSGYLPWPRSGPGGDGKPAWQHAILSRLTDLPGKKCFPSISRDAGFFVYAGPSGGRSHIFRQQVQDGKPLDLTADSPADDTQPALSPDGRQIAFRSERDGGGIYVMGATGESLRRLTDFGFNPAWSPDSREILCGTGSATNPRTRKQVSTAFRIDVATGLRQRIPAADARQPTWSPHRLRIAYWGVSPGGERVIWTVQPGSRGAVPVTHDGSLNWNPVWSPDGRYLYFASDRNGVMNLWRVPIDERSGLLAGEPEPITTSSQASQLLSISQDGKHIVYASDDSTTALERVSFDPASGRVSGPAAVVPSNAQMIRTCDVSRDGRWLTFQYAFPHETIAIVHPDGTGLRQLIGDSFKNRVPHWSPDCSRIAFYSNRAGRYDIWTVSADGNRLTQLTPAIAGRSTWHPIWSPDGSQLACDLEENEALIDLARPFAERTPQPLPLAGPGIGFSASSWSADGRWLAGVLHRSDQQQLPGIVVYSLAERRYRRLAASGEIPAWLADSRRLLYSDAGRLILFDTRTGSSQPILSTPPGSIYNDFSLSADGRSLYLVRIAEQGDIWLLTMK